MARYTVSPSGDVILAMSVAEAIGLQLLLGCEQPDFNSPSLMRAATRARATLETAVGQAKLKGHARLDHSQSEALKRLDREEG